MEIDSKCIYRQHPFTHVCIGLQEEGNGYKIDLNSSTDEIGNPHEEDRPQTGQMVQEQTIRKVFTLSVVLCSLD